MIFFNRRLARNILIVWLASWALTILQPYCEAVASALPHGHAQAHDVGAEHHIEDADVVPNHTHCEPELVDASDLSAPVREKFQLNHSKPKLHILSWRVIPFETTIAYARAILPAFHHPPSGSDSRLYLQTQRLRI